MLRFLGRRSHKSLQLGTNLAPKTCPTHDFGHGNPRSLRFYSRSNRFYRAEQTFRYLQTNPRVLGLLVAGGGLFYVSNLEEVPGSGRRRFNWVSHDLELRLSQHLLESVLQEYSGQILSEDTAEAKYVQKVIDRLIPHTGISDPTPWEVRVIHDRTANAFVIPGNKVFVFTGILNITQNEDGLAAVLGHEIAHNVAHHTGESLSRKSLLLPLALAVMTFVDTSAQLTNFFLNTLIQAPGSRKQESEADYLGLLIMARSCYNPEEAVKLWERMHAHEQVLAQRGEGSVPPQFLSTHPSTPNRIQKIKEWLPEAMSQSDASDCGQTSMYSNDFQGAWKRHLQDDTFE